MPTAVRSYAKINLGLRIGPVRPDGFHDLATVYQTVDVWDRVTVSARAAKKTAITLRCSNAYVPCDARNTAWKAVELALQSLNFPAEVDIEIEKKLPVQGGLGAGSANAVAALLGLERELAGTGCARELTGAGRLALAERVGSDVPQFLVGGTSLGLDRGQRIVPLADSKELACVLALPALAVSTPQAFRDWDALVGEPAGPAPGLAATPAPDELAVSPALTGLHAAGRINELSRTVAAVWAGCGSSGVFSAGESLAQDPVLALVRTGIENDFEHVVFPQQTLLRDLRAALAGDVPGISPQEKAIVAMLSGSGAALFGLYADDAAALAASERVEAMGVTALRTTTVSRGRYWQEMFE